MDNVLATSDNDDDKCSLNTVKFHLVACEAFLACGQVTESLARVLFILLEQ